MRRGLILYMLFMLMSFSATAQENIKSRMDKIEKDFGISFVYASSLPVESMPVADQDYGETLPKALEKTFSGTGIKYAVRKNNVILTLDKKEKNLTPASNIVADGSIVIDAAVITSGRDAGIMSSRPGSMVLTRKLIESTPAVFGEPDILKTLQLLPGIQNVTDGFSGINVRGGGADENLILLDGTALYNCSHLLGLSSVFSPEMVKSVTVYKSAFPARYGGRASSVVDIRTGDGNFSETHGVVSIGLISDKIYIEGPLKKNKASFSISGRLMQTGLFAPVMKAFGVPANYWFYDLNAKIAYRISGRDYLYAGFFNDNDIFRFKEPLKENNDADGRYAAGENALKLVWGNMLGSVGWKHVYSEKLSSNLTVAANRYNMNLSSGQDIHINDGGIGSYTKSSFSLSSGILDLNSRFDFDFVPVQEHMVRFGAEVIGRRFRPESVYSIEKSGGEGTAEEDKKTDMLKGKLHSGLESSVYAEDDIRLADWLLVCPGIRLSVYFAEGRTYINPEPRLSVKADICEGLFTKVSVTRMAQYVHMLSSNTTSLPTDMWVPVTKKIKPMISDQVSAGMYYTRKEGWEFSLEGYWKRMDNMLEYLEYNPPFYSTMDWEESVAMGEGRSFGLELMCEKKVGRATGMLAYTLSKSERIFPDGSINGGKWFPSANDRRHKLSAMINYAFNERIDASATFSFASGSWYTLPERRGVSVGPDLSPKKELCITERNNYRLPPVHHLDIGVNFHKKKPRGERIWNVGVYNVYGAHNPIFLNSTTNALEHSDPSIPDGAILITRRSLFMFMPSVNYIRKF